MIVQALGKVFRKPLYILLACIVSFSLFAFVTWLPNFHLVVYFIGSSYISLLQKLELLTALLGSITTNFTPLAASYTIAISILFGIDVAMLVYYLKNKINGMKREGITIGFFGIISGFLGMGCAACGSLLLTTALSFVGASSIIAFLPLAGQEFGILGVILLGFSVYSVAKRIQNPEVCNI